MIEPTSFGVGVIVGVLALFVLWSVAHRLFHETPQQATQRLTCEACGSLFKNELDAKRHAIGEHPAIDATTWESIISEA